jgi:hypothetical protein
MGNFLGEWIDTGHARRAVQAAYQSKYPDRTMGLVAPYKSDDLALFVVVLPSRGPTSWWSVSRSDFQAVETPEPDDWPKQPK